MNNDWKYFIGNWEHLQLKKLLILLLILRLHLPVTVLCYDTDLKDCKIFEKIPQKMQLPDFQLVSGSEAVITIHEGVLQSLSNYFNDLNFDSLTKQKLL